MTVRSYVVEENRLNNYAIEPKMYVDESPSFGFTEYAESPELTIIKIAEEKQKMPGDTTTDDAATVEVVVPTYPRITSDYYITKSVGVGQTGIPDPNSVKTYVNVIVTLTQVEIGDFTTVWDNLKSNITANTTAMTT